MKSTKVLIGGTLTALLWMTPVFAQQQDEDPVAAAQRTQTPQSVLRMARDVEKSILSLTDYGVFDSITYQIKDYTVVLKGFASRPILKDSAEKVVRKVEGVTDVVNEIKVLSLSPNDDRIRARVYAAIYYHPMLSRYNPGRGVPVWFSPARVAGGITNDPPIGWHPIHIIVNNGNVTLDGVVDNAADQQVAGMQANSVSGVFSVENHILVANPSKPKAVKTKK
ncbi:BON domain-containing protein [uncultured Paludibaculum sp.]|uniref:BON domain-containing protein n=1 Tax=uncultured Paludibaculum sp. TaxID=1765020 RepID=UPI002AAC4427|nr:BON domain-containing protein [uncultured Paludibaculum sp.]